MSLSVCLVERPSPFRAELQAALEELGNRVELWDDALAALASSEAIAADVVAVGDDNDATASSLLRVLERRGKSARFYRLTADMTEAPLPTRSTRVPRSFGAAAVAAALLREASAGDEAFACDVGAQQLGQLLIWLRDRSATGVLLLQAEGYERELSLIMGKLVHSRSTQPGERLGAIAIKQGVVQPEQLDAALMHARASGKALGRALIDLDLIEASALFDLLARQTREQVEASCGGGPYKARFRPDHKLGEQLDLYPLHPMTALVGAAQRISPTVVATTLDRGAARSIVERSSSETVASWLRASGVSLELKASTLGALRTSLAEQLSSSKLHVDTLVLALFSAGMRLGEAPRAPGAAPSLPPPVGASLVRVLDARSPFKPPLVSAPRLTAPLDDWQRALHEALGDPGAPSALPEEETISAELRALYVVYKTGRDPFELIGVGHAATQAEIDLAYCARLEALDKASEESNGPTVRLRKLELRRAFDRAHAILTQRAAADTQARASSVQVGRASSVANDSGAIKAMPAALPPATVLELEPLVRKASWVEVATWIEQKHPGGNDLAPGLALLYAIALKEAPPSETARSPLANQADRLGLRAVSELLGVGDDTAIALVVSKRALRKRPLEWQKEPPKRVSITLMLIALIVGAAVGLAVSSQSITLPF